MIIIDTLLRERARHGDPIKVALVGAGFMGRGLTNQICNSVPGMELVAIVNRHPDRAVQAYREAGVHDVRHARDRTSLEHIVAGGGHAVTDDAGTVCAAGCVDAVVEATGAVEYGCQVVIEAIRHGKHVILMNAEVDATVGPLLAHLAAERGVVYTGCDGDQPGVQLNLVRFVRGIGLTPLVCGNVKGLQDRFRTPETQKAFAERWGQDAHMVTSFADGTKISVEQATVANATGMTVEQRGMRGADHAGHIDELVTAYDVDELREAGGYVDYVVGSRPGPGVFVLATHDDPRQRHYLELYKLGVGPLYSFYTPYHLCHFEVPTTVARAVLLGDAAIVPAGPPRVEVITKAKRFLPGGTVLDGLGGFDSYGEAERAEVAAAQRLLPIGVAEGSRLLRDIAVDEPIGYDDVTVPSGRLVDELRDRQAELFSTPDLVQA